jgi:probable rRNA maturation factor
MKVTVLGTRDGRLVSDIRSLARRLNRDFGATPLDASVILVNDRYIHDLNRRFRGRDRPTDVLSFNLQSSICNLQSAIPLGEVYISRDTARRQAREYGVAYRDEVRRLALHGLLHLLGLTHGQMEPLYDKYLGRA